MSKQCTKFRNTNLSGLVQEQLSRSQRSCQTMQRGAFTLLELLLALAASGLLMSAISSSVLFHYRTTFAAERQIEQTRTVMALSSQFRSDLSRLRHGQKYAKESLTESNELAQIEPEIRQRVLQFDESFTLETIDVYGTEDFLSIGTIAIANPDDTTKPSHNPLVQQRIIWTTIQPALWTIPYLDAAGFVNFQTQLADDPFPDTQAVRRAVLHLCKSARLVQAAEYPSEIVELRFRYFDGLNWRSSWNSVTKGVLPAAIEFRVLLSGQSEWIRLTHTLDRSGKPHGQDGSL